MTFDVLQSQHCAGCKCVRNFLPVINPLSESSLGDAVSCSDKEIFANFSGGAVSFSVDFNSCEGGIVLGTGATSANQLNFSKVAVLAGEVAEGDARAQKRKLHFASVAHRMVVHH